MSRTRSPNCDEENAKPKTLFTFTGTHPQHVDKQFSSFMLSCQPKNLETPDLVTLNAMKRSSAHNLEEKSHSPVKWQQVEIDSIALRLGAQTTDAAAQDVIKDKMASNCSGDLNKVNSFNHYTCNYVGTGTDENGRTVRNPFQRWKGILPSCEKSFELSEETEDDIQKMVYYHAGGKEANLNVNDFVCSITSLPSI